MSNLDEKCQFVALCGYTRGEQAVKELIAVTVLHYPMSAPAREFYNEGYHYIGTTDKPDYKIHVFFSASDEPRLPERIKAKLKQVIERVQPENSRGQFASMIFYQVQLHKMAQERARHELQTEQT